MILIYRIIIKLRTVWKNLQDKAYIALCKSQGLKVGKDVIFIEAPDFGSEPYLIEIDDRTKITAGCKFITHDGAMYVIRSLDKYADVRNFGRIKIGKNCFVGNNSIFLPGAKMGDNCILGAGSLLNSTMEDNSVYAGVPAKFICSIDDYGKKALENNTIYPRALENDRKKMNDYLKENLPHQYKPVKK